MPAKRKRPADDENEMNAGSSSLESRPKRRRNDTTLVDTIQYIFDALRNQMKDDNTYLCEAFLRVPRKKNEPQYYEVVTNPIDMLKIQQKLKTDMYNELKEFCDDVELLVENAKLYFAKSTEEHKDACDLWDIFIAAKHKAPQEIQERLKQQSQDDDDGTLFTSKKRRGRLPRAIISSSPMVVDDNGSPMSLEDAVEELFAAIVTANDQDGRIFCFDFIFLPSSDNYPEYYEIIKHPLDLKIIAQRLQNKCYKNLEAIERDFILLFENACTFNEPGSQIYKDARSLIKMVEIRKQEIVQVLSQNGMKLRTKRPPGNRKWSDVLASINEGDEFPLSEDEQVELSVTVAPPEDEDSDDDFDTDSDLWQFFVAIKSLTLPSDPTYYLIEPFRKLPSRRFYADYYHKIKNPIALCQIKNKLKKGEYLSLSELVDDFNLMLDNAKRYNRQDSKIYKDASKLQKFIKTKTENVANVTEVYESDSESEDETLARIDEATSGSRRKSSSSRPWTFKRRAKLIFKTLMDYMTDDLRQPIVAFIEKPAKSEYPDYYEVIEDPIDMETIETKIKGEQYQSDDDLISDFRLMFANCQKFNEEISQIYQDSKILKRVLNEKVSELKMGNEGPPKARSHKKKDKTSAVSNVYKALKSLYSTICDFTDNQGRQLSEVFVKLPARALYPDYYEVIKQPMDLDKISLKLKNITYVSMDDMLSDLNLLFGNACRYNDPESQIYRDALSLHKLTLQTRLELCNKYDLYPNVQSIVQEMLISLFITVFNHEDSEGRYTAESFSELPEREEGSVVLSFDIMKRRLDCGHYTRMDTFQEDLFAIFGRARRHAKLNSKLYQDSVTLQRIYIKTRDEMCGNGAVLESKALSIKLKELNDLLVTEATIIKPETDLAEDTNDGITEDEDSKTSIQTNEGMNNSSVSHNEVQYYVGDFVYMHPQEKNCDNAIFHIQRLWTNSYGQQMLYGCRYYRPPETYHLPNRKFYEQEVFKTENLSGHPLSEVIGKCVVMSPIDFPKYSVDGMSEKDVFVCESRYSSKTRTFKKIKAWPFALPQSAQLTERSELLDMKKIESVFKDRNEKQMSDLEEEAKNIKRSGQNIVKPNDNDTSGNTCYYQYTIPIGQVILGDFVYIRSNFGRAVRHVTKIFSSPEGNSFITGVKFAYARDVKIATDRPPYTCELYLTVTQETFPVTEVISKCCVLHITDYLTMRHTEIPESDVYVCEKFYDEANQRLCKLQSGMLKFSLPQDVTTNEIYHLFKQMPLSKLETVTQPPKKVIKTETPQRSVSRRPLTGYALFSSEIRKSVTARNQGANYGEINRLVSIEWKRLTEAERKAFEDRAHQMNAEHADKRSADSPLPPTPQASSSSIKGPAELPLPSNPDAVFECLWESCDFMFEDIADLYDHLMAENTGHVQKVAVFECAMRGCPRHKKSSMAPFPSLNRLMRHLREIHISKNNGRILQGLDRSRNFVASSRRSLLLTIDSGSHTSANASANYNVIPGLSVGRDNQYQITLGAPIEVNGHANRGNIVNGQRFMDPMFVAPPPKTQRLLHSEAYIKYIENLDKPFVSNWEGQLSSTMENTINDAGRLPANWLTNGAGNHGSVVSALWALREYMMKDSLGIAKIL